MIPVVAAVVSRLMDWWAPLAHQRHVDAFRFDTWLADAEADHESWQPDELWSAHQRFTAATSEAAVNDTGIPPRSPVSRPADSRPAQVDAVGGPLKSDEQIIEELVADYRDFLRDCFARTHRK